MRVLIFVVLAVLLALVLAAVASSYVQGPVAFSAGGYLWQMELVAFVVAVVVAFVLLHLLLVLLTALLRLPERLRGSLRKRRQAQVQAALAEGLSLLLEGQWSKAEQRFKDGFSHSRQGTHCYLGAAEAAFRQGHRAPCLRYLEKARQKDDRAALRAGLLEAGLLRSAGDVSGAIACLESLQQKHRGHRMLGERLLGLYREHGDWEAALRHAKRVSMPSAERAALLLQVHLGRLRPAPDSAPDQERLEGIWRSIPRSMRSDVRLLRAYVTESLHLPTAEHCEPLLRKALRRQYDPELASLYALVQGRHPSRQLAFLEGLLKAHPEDAQLLLAVGILGSRLKLWGKARSYIEQSRTTGATPENLYAMARLLEQQGDFEAATRCYRQGVDLLAGATHSGTVGLLSMHSAGSGDESAPE